MIDCVERGRQVQEDEGCHFSAEKWQPSRALMSSVAAIRAVLVLWLAQNPDWEGSRRLWSSKFWVSCWLIAFSKTLAG